MAIAAGRITAVGGGQGPAWCEIDATGLMVTPGWVDRMHYDGRAVWDPLLAPSMLAWRDDCRVWQLRRGLRGGEEASSPGL